MSTPDLFDQKVKHLHFDAPKDCVLVRPEHAVYFVWCTGARIASFPTLQGALKFAGALRFRLNQDLLIYNALGTIDRVIEKEMAS